MDIVKATGVNTFHKVRSTNISIHTEERENFCSFANNNIIYMRNCKLHDNCLFQVKRHVLSAATLFDP